MDPTPPLTLEKFAQLVEGMRAAQRRYFRDRGSNSLQVSKALEREVDRACEEILRPAVPEPTLFPIDF